MNSNASIQKQIEKLYDHLYANSAKKTPAAIAMEVGKILHVGVFLEVVERKSPAFSFSRSEIRSIEKGNGGILFSTVADEVKNVYVRMNKKWSLYDPNSFIELSDFDLVYTVSQLNDISFADYTKDVLGDAFEIFRSEWAKREGGMFFTDQRVTHLSMVLLQFDPRKGDDLIDISAGTAGFLSAGLNYIRILLEEDGERDNVERQVVDLAKTSIKGQEIDEHVAKIANSTLSARTGLTDFTFVKIGDSLSPTAFLGKGEIQEGKHLCIATNPPFGTKITIKDPKILFGYELGRLSNRIIGSDSISTRNIFRRPPDILFLEKNIRLLKPGSGRLAIVLPYQILSGPQMLYVRNWLLKHVVIEAVIDLPSETFQPHTGTKTSLVLMKRRLFPLTEAQSCEKNRIFMSLPKWIGHDRRGNPVYERNSNGSFSENILTDFPDVEKAYKAFLRGEDCSNYHTESFVVDECSIVSDPLLKLNALYYKPTNNTVGLRSKKGWKLVPLGSVVKQVFFPGRFKRQYVERSPHSIPFFGGSNITQLITETDKWLSPNDPKLDQLIIRAGWILITRSGSTGIISSVPPAWDGVAMSEHVIRIVPDNNALPGEYIHAFLKTEHAQSQLKKGVFGSVIDEIDPEYIKDIKIPIPTSKRKLMEITGMVQQAEEARQVALEQSKNAIDYLNSEIAY